MKTLPCKTSAAGSIGVELEFQIVNPKSYTLISRAKELICNIKESEYETRIKPEITQSMIEINTSIHATPKQMFDELIELHGYLLQQIKNIDILMCGGGTHPFQKWSTLKIFPTKRFKKLYEKYRYLSKRSTVFGQHVHVGCKNVDDILYLTQALMRYVPHFIAMAASSPFYQGVDTGYYSSRASVFSSFPLSGVMPFINSWEEFSDFFYKMQDSGIVDSMKDFYWDIRPKPEFGTVEIRVCDTPLTIKKAVVITAYIQALALYLLENKPLIISKEIYYFYNYNRFQASRYGFDGDLIDPSISEKVMIADDILRTIKKIEHHANQLGSMGYISLLVNDVLNKENDAKRIRRIYNGVYSLPKVVKEQCSIWSSTLE